MSNLIISKKSSFGNFLNQYEALTEIRKTDNPLTDIIDNIKGEA